MICALYHLFEAHTYCIFRKAEIFFVNQNRCITFASKLIKTMRIVTFKIIQEYTKNHPDADTALRNWYKNTKDSNWNCFADIKRTYGSVDSAGNNRYVFNIKGNAYRLIAIIIFVSKQVYIRFIGTHDEYNKIKDCSQI
jgi:mRNA interferase HigB